MSSVFDNINIGNINCKNRILRSATWEALADEKGFMSDKQYEIYEELAKNDVGLISTGYARIMESDCPNAGMMGIYDDCFIPSYKKLTDIVHKHNGKIMMQIAYGGTKTTYKVNERTIFCPSGVPEITTGTKGKEMTIDDIKLVAKAHGEAARRVKESGFDAVQIHAGHNYLLNQFLSPYYNRRADEYGGSIENRARAVIECYDEVRKAVGKDYTVMIKITCTDFTEGGFSFDDCLTFCKMLEKKGIDCIEISGNIHGKAEKMAGYEFDGHSILKDGYFVEYGKIIADKVNVPIYVTGGFRSPEYMNKILSKTNISGFGISRPFLTEPDLVKRWILGDTKKAKCVHCSKCRTPEGNYCTVFCSK
ncbi:oxidoreductase [Tyzzerella sp. An114]|uniref:NADH:flavin oxidoreductase n=1 Tax=Tyzzerella sp. An114 TaxID=1965545 RepID=UPI000B43194A|nr:NADH:flavin oxidoreductase [Tyzzerella sp. An114]OUQ56967.1 oxidoreductase [Tyzzerella sp. An114]